MTRGGRAAVVLLAAVLAGCKAETAPPDRTTPAASTPPAEHAASPGQTGPCDAAETQLELTRCWTDARHAAESKAQAAFAALADRVHRRNDTDLDRQFQTADERWTAFVEAQCSAQTALYKGGSMAALEDAHCRADLAEQRRQQLEAARVDSSR
jgi:uncharacterized protein YecT (DUF1311 family)